MKRAIFIMSLSSLFSLFSCATPGGNGSETRITKFNYNYDGTIGGNSHRYEVSVSGQTAAVKVYDMLHHDYGDMTDTVGAQHAHQVRQVAGLDGTHDRPFPGCLDPRAARLHARVCLYGVLPPRDGERSA